MFHIFFIKKNYVILEMLMWQFLLLLTKISHETIKKISMAVGTSLSTTLEAIYIYIYMYIQCHRHE